jgi:hypothetical protein
LHGPSDNADRLCQQKDKQLAAGVNCEMVYLEDVKQYAVVRIPQTTHKYKVGDYVAVYQKPVTEEDFEGKAVIVAIRHTPGAYDVRFVDDASDLKQTHTRFVY